MPSVDEIYGGNFLNAMLVKSEKLVGKPLTISNVEVQKIGRGDSARNKLVVTFREISKQLVLNKTNSNIIAESYGQDYSQWVDKRIFLQLTKRQYQGQLVDAVSVACETPTQPFMRWNA